MFYIGYVPHWLCPTLVMSHTGSSQYHRVVIGSVATGKVWVITLVGKQDAFWSERVRKLCVLSAVVTINTVTSLSLSLSALLSTVFTFLPEGLYLWF